MSVSYQNTASGEEIPVYIDHQDIIHRTPWWMISFVFHAALVMMTMMIVVSEVFPDDPVTIVEMDIKQFRQPQYDRTVTRDIIKSSKTVDNEILVADPVITKEDLPIDKLQTPDNSEDDGARGRKEALSTVELNNNGWTGVMGIGGLASGALGDLRGRGKRPAIGKNGGSEKTESAVSASLEWFKRHQAPDGSWAFDSYWQQCSDNPPCDHMNLDRDFPSWENAATGFGLLCFLGAGNTPRAGRYRMQVMNGLSFLTQNVQGDGSFSSNNYVNAIAAMAVAEAYAMTRDEELRGIGQKAVDTILSRQNDGGYLGWDYGRPTTRNDTSVTGWQVMALKSAKMAHLEIGNAFEGAAAHFEKVTPRVEGDEYNPSMDNVSYIYKTDTGDKGHKNTTLTAISLLCRIFMGQNIESRLLKAHAEQLLTNLPDPAKGDFYQWYYGTLAMFQMRGKYWKAWNGAMKPAFCDTQCMGGCADGSWNPPENSRCHGVRRGGRLFTTATACLSLQVYYRYPYAMGTRK